ncbi:MAG TPA: hypothetical protein VKA48_10950 [Gammaproteobacteria bacterium]|nr:hypothetical protein [Gammaproteobacteria bacterium]
MAMIGEATYLALLLVVAVQSGLILYMFARFRKEARGYRDEIQRLVNRERTNANNMASFRSLVRDLRERTADLDRQLNHIRSREGANSGGGS